jgi:hypothetical protein
MQNFLVVDTVFSSRRRGWILLTAIAATFMFSWSSISGLNELVELQQLPGESPISFGKTSSDGTLNNLSTNKGTLRIIKFFFSLPCPCRRF